MTTFLTSFFSHERPHCLITSYSTSVETRTVDLYCTAYSTSVLVYTSTVQVIYCITVVRSTCTIVYWYGNTGTSIASSNHQKSELMLYYFLYCTGILPTLRTVLRTTTQYKYDELTVVVYYCVIRLDKSIVTTVLVLVPWP